MASEEVVIWQNRAKWIKAGIRECFIGYSWQNRWVRQVLADSVERL